MDDTALEAREAVKVYRRGARPALAGVDIAIPRGSITALVGPNGAGKSTLMKAWVGFERLTRGRVLVHGIDPSVRRADALSRIGYVPQAVGLYRELSVADHVDLARSLRPSFDRGRALRRLADLGIPPAQPASHLSAGQQVQLWLALVLASGADTFLLDEPLAVLDPLARREVIHILVDHVRRWGATAVVTSHVATDVEQAADRLIVLSDGQKLLDEEIAAALARHRIHSGHVSSIAADGLFLDGASVVASFPGPREILTLVEVPTDGRPVDALRPATLEEVMLGYLAAGRPDMTERLLSRVEVAD
ncbi:MAG TPA: ABC transporter ATP-binding protein [Candidatus Limnocylindrales bacterium]|nr:ABC transporter ATP-binding protein [Candidatus Limnocylindrales bacterium]